MKPLCVIAAILFLSHIVGLSAKSSLHFSIAMDETSSRVLDYSDETTPGRQVAEKEEQVTPAISEELENNIENYIDEDGPYRIKIRMPEDNDVEDFYYLPEDVTNYAPNFIISGPGSEQLIEDPVEEPPVKHISTNEETAGMDPELEEQLLRVRQRLQKLDFYFGFLRVMSEDCRQRMLCEVLREPSKFYPLSSILEDATSFSDEYFHLNTKLLSTTDGARLMSYLDAAFSALDRERSCTPYRYRCPSRTEEMVNYESLTLWREMVRWLTIHVIARSPADDHL